MYGLLRPGYLSQTIVWTFGSSPENKHLWASSIIKHEQYWIHIYIYSGIYGNYPESTALQLKGSPVAAMPKFPHQ